MEKIRVIDCVPYNGEPIALFRLEYLWDVVDEFVMVEARQTHAGDDKGGLYLDKNAPALERFKSKITRLVIDAFPAIPADHPSLAATTKSYRKPDAWFREKYQRNIAGDFLRRRGDQSGFIIMACDVDEIPRREIVAVLPERYETLHLGLKFDMALFYYSSDWITRDRWRVPFAINDKALEQHSLDEFRLMPIIKKAARDAGWHFSYFMTDDDMLRKIKSSAHTEHNKPEYCNLEWVRHCKNTGVHIFGAPKESDCIRYTGTDLPENLRAFEVEHGIRS